MCGIFGILKLQGELDSKAFSIPNSTDVLRRRGPDDYGYYLDSNVYLGHRRLSIIDLGTGKQPIFNENETKVVIFNGEIFNFQDIKCELESYGHHFKTRTDTEVIVHAYEQWGNECIGKFRGMFAFGLWDSEQKRLFLARDRLGIKPLFYAIYDDVFYFASEMKAILQYQHFPRDLDKDGLAAYFTLSYIPAPFTIFKYIRKLPAGHSLEIKDGSMKISQYWDIIFESDRTKSEGYFIEGINGLLEEAVKLRMISDVPIGAFLSGGVDSGAVVALMSRQSSSPVRSFCMGFGGNVGGYLDERDLAKQIASKYNTIHKEYEVQPDVSGIIDDIVQAFDEPFADHSTIPTYYLCKLARQDVKVAISGLGGDEAFGGYERYSGLKFSMYYSMFPRLFREGVIKAIVEKLPERVDGHYTSNHLKRFVRSASFSEGQRYFGFLSMIGKDTHEIFTESEKYEGGLARCRDLILSYFNACNAVEPIDKAVYCDIKTYLPDDILACTDRISMWHSLEVRVPFLDHKLLEFCAQIPNEMKIGLFQKKKILKRAVSDILPSCILKHRKQGFVGPMTRWLQSGLKSYVLTVLSDKNLERHGIINKAYVQRILREHFNRIEIHDKLIWSLVMFQKWFESYIERRFPPTS